MTNTMQVACWMLRVGAGACFVGHGAFGIMRKQAWLPFFAFAGISPQTAEVLMPIIGTIDIVVGLAVLVRPRPVLLGYMTVWAIWTAALRPLTGDHAWELIERAGNFGVPLALLLLWPRPSSLREWFAGLRDATALPERMPIAASVLAGASALLLLGHGALSIGEKPLLVQHYALLGLRDAAPVAAHFAGLLEIGLAILIISRPTPRVALSVCAWKLATESLFVVSGAPIWELVERTGSFAAPLALAVFASAGAIRPARLTAVWPRRVMTAVVCAVLGCIGLLPASVGAQQAARPEALVPSELLALLRRGNAILACRHAITDRSHEDRMPLALNDRESQRNLNAAGEDQARQLGASIRAARVPIGRVLASPYYRTYETAVLAFGAADRNDSLRNGRSREFRALLSGEQPVGGNSVLMTHNGVLSPVFQGLGIGEIQEGDCVVVNPRAGGFQVVQRVSPAQFKALGSVSEP